MTFIRRPARRGFTLVELIVVIAIILILMSLVSAGVMKILLLQQNKSTQDEVTKLETARANAYTRVLDAAKNEPPCQLAVTWSNGDPQLAQVLHIKLRLRQEFPQSFAEVQNPLGVPAKQTYQRALQNAQPGIHSAFEQSSILLYLSLKESRRCSEFDPDSALAAQEIRTTTDGLKVIVDAYRNPIVFIRWPALPNLDPTVVSALPALSSGLTTVVKTPPIDAEDPEGIMSRSNYIWFGTPSGLQFTQSCHGPSVIGTTPYPLRPVIASTGVNAKLGDADDFYSFNLVLGGNK
jgi:prepilin-type N-terminal cleavage/methylation domain-containing protein